MRMIRLGITATLLAFASPSFSQTQLDLHQLAKDSGISVYGREMTLINEPGHEGISLSKDLGEGIAWLKGIEFSNGTIEFDVRGENLKQHSFVGFVFHAQDNETFDAIYLRLPKTEMGEDKSHQMFHCPLHERRCLQSCVALYSLPEHQTQ